MHAWISENVACRFRRMVGVATSCVTTAGWGSCCLHRRLCRLQITCNDARFVTLHGSLSFCALVWLFSPWGRTNWAVYIWLGTQHSNDMMIVGVCPGKGVFSCSHCNTYTGYKSRVKQYTGINIFSIPVTRMAHTLDSEVEFTFNKTVVMGTAELIDRKSTMLYICWWISRYSCHVDLHSGSRYPFVISPEAV